MLGGFLQWVYGFFFGYGYQPWRYALLVVFPIIVAFAAWYHYFYFPIFAPIVDRTIPEGLGATQHEIRIRRHVLNYYPSRLSDIPIPRRIFLALFFSLSVLLAFRFKRDWLTKNARFFNIVVLQYFVGLLLYFSFIYYARGAYIETVRSILGF